MIVVRAFEENQPFIVKAQQQRSLNVVVLPGDQDLRIRRNDSSSARIKVASTSGGLLQQAPDAGITIVSSGVLDDSITRLDRLSDVVEVDPSDGATLVYDQDTDTYETRQLDLDGGIF